ncbi:MAG: hypothetical protein WCP55_25450 [Lentisphaerota bacterium]
MIFIIIWFVFNNIIFYVSENIAIGYIQQDLQENYREEPKPLQEITVGVPFSFEEELILKRHFRPQSKLTRFNPASIYFFFCKKTKLLVDKSI